MLLVIDVGNTHTVLGVYRDEERVRDWRIATLRTRAADEYGVLFHSLFSLADLPVTDVHSVVIASVVPPAVEGLVRASQQYLNVDPMLVGPGMKTGMPILYDNPREVGADRIVNSVAAYERCHTGAIVVDFGTATTFDVISPKGEYLGGTIAPGVRTAAEALYARTSKLPRVEIVHPTSAIGKNTVASIQSGLYFGYASLVDGLVQRLSDEVDFPVRVYATGGLAPLISEVCTAIDEVDENLTLDGLRILWERNR